MDKADIPFLAATELSGLIEKKEVSPVEAVEAFLERIDRVDGKLNSYVTVCRDEALQAAREAEQAIARGSYLGPMHGIPTAVKDQCYTKGIRTTAGSTILWDFVPDEDATVVANLKKAGAVILGKLNMSEFALGDSFYHPAGTPRNPWDLERNPGISSSGSSAATAAFLCSTSLGEDTGGSTRIPAGWCGLVGLRPTWGRVSRYGVVPVIWSMDTIGPVSRTVEDCAITFQAIAGYDPKDPYTSKSPVPDYRRSLAGDVKGVRVGLIREKVYGDDVDSEVRDAVIKATGVLRELGASVEEVSLPLISKSGAFSKCLTDMEGAAVHHKWLKTPGEGLRPQLPGAPPDGRTDARPGVPQGTEAPSALPGAASRIAGTGGPVGSTDDPHGGSQDTRLPRHPDQRRSRQSHLRRSELHRRLQPC